MFPLVSAAILKLMVKITSIFGSYRFLKNSIARHFLTFRSLSSQLEFVLILGSRRENAHLVKFKAWTIQSPYRTVRSYHTGTIKELLMKTCSTRPKRRDQYIWGNHEINDKRNHIINDGQYLS